MADSNDNLASGYDYSQRYYSQYGGNYDPAAYYASSSSASNFPFPGSSSSAPRPVVANAAEYDLGIAAQQSAYVPGAQLGRGGAGGKVAPGQKRTTVLRKGAGKVWEDKTLLEWDPKWFRLFVGDLSNDVSDDVLTNAFNKYPTFTKARVIRDRLTQKARYGFVAFSDPEDFLKAWKEMDGKYVGNRPIKLKKAETGVRPVEIGARKAKSLEVERRKKHKPY
ncbi:RNA-binding domain-containing protein [Dacryopinax primogenitus]|uniref:RNA-binding domain-containing protein n=1 Tax=Dacryopinax primogenitus (strain DJM 731) TaxID=1858805 RepID=M5GC13_DACPD|nr:RNA-binding domain-containing protein [Dacryopinax primogenitus]EJU06010.1 RNA-binding domain-containing protein [Dacryopinax primogenitus]